jgi:hypothetical protein
MSIHTLKVKSNRFQNKISGGINNPNGFSLVGGYRNLPYIGQTSLSKSVTRTPFRGNLPMGHGGSNGEFKISIANSGSCCFNDPNIIKKSVGSSKYAIIHKNKWLHSAYPNLITKNNEMQSQSDYINKLKIKNSKCTKNIKRGLQYFIYDDDFFMVDNPIKEDLDAFMEQRTPIASGVSLNFSNLYTSTNGNLSILPTLEYFSVYFKGYFRADKTGTYQFVVNSDDACCIYIDGVLNVNDTIGGAHNSIFEMYGTPISMVAGNYYFIEIYYKQTTDNQDLIVSYIEPGTVDWISDTTNLYTYFQEIPVNYEKTIKGDIDCDNIDNGNNRCRQRSHYIGGKKYVSTLYSKNNNKYTLKSSEYQSTELMNKRDLPTPDCKKPFPFVIPNNNKRTNIGSKFVWFKTPEEAIQNNYLPSDWMNCNIYKNSKCLYNNLLI